MKTALEFVILCSNRCLKNRSDHTAKKKSFFPRCCFTVDFKLLPLPLSMCTDEMKLQTSIPCNKPICWLVKPLEPVSVRVALFFPAEKKRNSERKRSGRWRRRKTEPGRRRGERCALARPRPGNSSRLGRPMVPRRSVRRLCPGVSPRRTFPAAQHRSLASPISVVRSAGDAFGLVLVNVLNVFLFLCIFVVCVFQGPSVMLNQVGNRTGNSSQMRSLMCVSREL